MSDQPIVRRSVVISDKDPMGLHMRPAQALVQLALRYHARIELIRDELRVDAKSIFDVMTLAAEPGTVLVLEAQGDDADEAAAELARYIESGFAAGDETQCQSPAQ